MHFTQRNNSTLIGMTVSFPRLDLEAAATEILAAGYGGIEVFSGQVGPGVFDLPGEDAHARASRRHLEARGLVPVLLNSIDGSFDPLRKPESSIAALTEQLKLADALGMPRILIWDGIHDGEAAVSLDEAPDHLAQCISGAIDAAGLDAPPTVSVELHPFTFALEHERIEQAANALMSVGAGICLDVSHFAVAQGAGFAGDLTDSVLDAVNHVHWCDSDCRTEGLHFPPGAAAVDLDSLEAKLAGRKVVLALDLFGWPAPREAMRDAREEYAALVRRHAGTLERT